MKHILTALLLTVLVGVSHVAEASDWKQVTSTEDYDLLVETESIQSKGTRSKAWVKLLYKRPVKIDDQSGIQHARSAVSITAFDCADRAYLDLQTTTYADRDSVVVIEEHKRTDFRADYHHVRPDTAGETMFNFVCRAATPILSDERPNSMNGTRGVFSDGSFSPIHWVIVFLTIANIAAVVHIALAPMKDRRKKAAWVVGALLVPFIPYIVWTVLRRSRLTSVT